MPGAAAGHVVTGGGAVLVGQDVVPLAQLLQTIRLGKHRGQPRGERRAGSAEGFEDGDAGRPAGLSRTDRLLLRLLADGLTDEAAAKRLGISARTVRRTMVNLMDRLAAESRFEAGVEAARRGWI